MSFWLRCDFEWLTMTTLQNLCSHWCTINIHPDLIVTTKSATNSTSATTKLLLNACLVTMRNWVNNTFQACNYHSSIEEGDSMGESGSYLKNNIYFKFVIQFPTKCMGMFLNGFRVYSAEALYVLPEKYVGGNHAALRFLSFYSVHSSTTSFTTHWSLSPCGYADFTSPR